MSGWLEAIMAGRKDRSTAQAFKYEETKRILDRQAAVLSELRDRANILLAANAIVATLFGSSALGKNHPLALKILALVTFGFGIGACISILWPVRDAGDLADPSQWRTLPRWPCRYRPRRWQVTFKPDDVAAYVEGTDSSRVDNVSKQFRLSRKTNWETIKRRTRFLMCAGMLLAVQVGLWSWLALS